jgi:hypothetical protein
MTPRRALALAFAIVLLFGAAVLAVLRLTDSAPSPAPVATRPGEPPLAVAAPPPPAPPAADDAACPPALRAAETLPAPRLEERWAMCRLFGNWEADRRASTTAGELVSIALSTEFPEAEGRRHVLVLARQRTAGGAPVAGRGAATRLDAHVYALEGGAWRHAASGALIAEAGPGGRAPELRLMAVGRQRSALLVTPAGGQAEGPARLVGVSAEGVSALADELPAGGTSEADCVPVRCFAWRAEITTSRGRGEWDDLVVHVKGKRPDDDERVWPVDETVRWVYRNGRYAPAP